MDLYRYFHPHHNPRLISEPVRALELSELEQAATELRMAIARAQVRSKNASLGLKSEENYEEILVALDFAIASIHQISEEHPGDEPEVLEQMIDERSDAPGWGNWTRLLRQRIELLTHGIQQDVDSNHDVIETEKTGTNDDE